LSNHTEFSVEYGHSVLLAPALESRISFSRNFVRKEPSPYSGCISDIKSTNVLEKKVYDFIFESNFSYRQIYCIDYYKQKYVIDECGCQSPWFIQINNEALLCDTGDPCYINAGNYYAFEKSLTDRDYKKCPFECDIITNDITMSFLKYPSAGYIEYLKTLPVYKLKFMNGYENVSHEQLTTQVTSFALYYQDFKYSVLSEVPLFSVISLVSNIGGTLGLFLGMSLLSFIEVLELLIEYIIHSKGSVSQAE
jgi:hypothetical protein